MERATIQKGISCYCGQPIINSNLHLLLYKTMVWHKPASHYKEQRVHFTISATHKEGAIHNISSSDKPYSHLDGIINRYTIPSSATKDQSQIQDRDNQK
jgi:hypothetical protein